MMSDKALILVADDDATIQELFAETLGGNYRIVTVDSGAAVLESVERLRPDIILLDVEMPPGISGYDTCRRLKAMDAVSEVPAIFVSGHDCIEDRIRGYEAGGQDYLTKPFDPLELEAKVTHLLKAAAHRASLKAMVDNASSTAMTAMTSMSELGALLESMKRFGACTDYVSLLDALLTGLTQYGLEGVAQIRTPEGTLTRNRLGEASPLEASVIGHMAGMERITQYRSRLAVTYARVSLLIYDMPTDDPDRCGRLRDHLAMLAEGADARAEAIEATAESQRRGAAIERAVAGVTATLATIDRAQRESQMAARLAVDALTQRMEMSFVSVAMTTAQENYMAGILKEGLENLLNTQTGVPDLQNKLSSIIKELNGMAA